MYVATYTRKTPKKVYYTHFLVESYRNEQGKSRQRRLLNISHLPEETIDAIRLALKGTPTLDWDAIPGLKSRQYGLPFAVIETLNKLGFPEILGADGLQKWPTIATMIANRVDRPCSKYALQHWIEDVDLPALLEQETDRFFHSETCYRTLDWLAENQTAIEDRLYKRRGEKPTLFLYDLTSSYFEGNKAELGAFGYSRDHRKDCKQICIGLLADTDGVPVATEVFSGNTTDCTTVPSQIEKMKQRFACEKAVFVGDRGMMTSANQEQLEAAGLDFILALKHREVLALVEEHGPRQMGLFDEKNIADIEVDGRRLIVCRNPIAGADTERRRDELLALSEEKLEKIRIRVEKGQLKDPAKIQRAIDRWLPRYKTEKFFNLDVAEGAFSWSRDVETIEAAAQLDGVYVLETTQTTGEMHAEKVQQVYKNLQSVERAFRSLKDELEVRPIRHWKADRIRGHVFMCVLAYTVEQMWRNALAELPEDERPEWLEFKEVLRRWRRARPQNTRRLRAQEVNLTKTARRYLNAISLSVP